MKRVLYFVMIFVLINSGTAWAGDPWRYADRTTWPDWAAEWSWRDAERKYPLDGELVDAIRFELIRGYPVTPQDYMKYEDREFRPNQAMTRAEFAAVLSRSQGLVSEDGVGADWFRPYVAVLGEYGIIPAGASEEWGAPISRREAAQWMGRAAEAFRADDLADMPRFVDVDDPLVERALRAGIVKGVGEGRFEPDRALLRVEAAVMLVRLARSRNSQVDPAVVEVLTDLAVQSNREASDRGKRWVEQGYVDEITTSGIRTQEYVDYLWYRVQDNMAVRSGPPKAWTVTDEESYRFRVIELHDSLAVLEVCGLDRVYRKGNSPTEPWFEQPFCGRGYVVLNNGRWLIAAVADATYEE